MNATKTPSPKTRLAVAHVLAQLLERLERSAVPVGAEQYQSVVQHLSDEFRTLDSAEGLGGLLDAYPAAAELYENLQYAHAGLCRSGLDCQLAAEMSAREAIARAMRTPREDAAHGEG